MQASKQLLTDSQLEFCLWRFVCWCQFLPELPLHRVPSRQCFPTVSNSSIYWGRSPDGHKYTDVINNIYCELLLSASLLFGLCSWQIKINKFNICKEKWHWEKSSCKSMSNMVKMLFIKFCCSRKCQFNVYLSACVIGQPKLLPVVSFCRPIKLSLLEGVVTKPAVICCFHQWGNLIKKCIHSSKTYWKDNVICALWSEMECLYQRLCLELWSCRVKMALIVLCSF